jgi:hypothetical protein
MERESDDAKTLAVAISETCGWKEGVNDFNNNESSVLPNSTKETGKGAYISTSTSWSFDPSGSTGICLPGLHRRTSTWLNCCGVRPKVVWLPRGEKSRSNVFETEGGTSPWLSFKIDDVPGVGRPESSIVTTLALSSKRVRDPVLFKALSRSANELVRPLPSLRRLGNVTVSTAVHSRDDFDHSEDTSNLMYPGMLVGGLDSRM